MKKHIWEHYDLLDYRVLANKLDELARAGWQLMHMGSFGLTFAEAASQEVYHRIIRSPQLSGEPIPAGWTFLLRQGDRTIITRDQPLSIDERLAEDQAMDYWGRQQRNVILGWLMMVGGYFGNQALYYRGDLSIEEWMLNGGMALVAALFLAECVCWQINAQAYWRAVRAKRPYEPRVKCRRLRLAGLWAIALCLALMLVLALLVWLCFI